MKKKYEPKRHYEFQVDFYKIYSDRSDHIYLSGKGIFYNFN